MYNKIKKNINLVLIGTATVIVWYCIWEIMDILKTMYPYTIPPIFILAVITLYFKVGEVQF